MVVRELGEPLYRGAEAYLYEYNWLGMKAILKIRIPKKYRHSAIDDKLRSDRVFAEVKAMYTAMEVGVEVPTIYYVDPVQKIIIMEYIEGKTLAQLVREDIDRAEEYSYILGTYTAKLHEAKIAHGDLTTSNAIVSSTTGKLYLVDFGLANLGSSMREQAIDIHLFMRSLESTHPEYLEDMLRPFLDGYSSIRGREVLDKLLSIVEEIRLMGRYVEERRTVWGRK